MEGPGEWFARGFTDMMKSKTKSTVLFISIFLISIVNMLMYQALPSDDAQYDVRKQGGGISGFAKIRMFSEQSLLQQLNFIINAVLLVYSIFKLYAINQYHKKIINIVEAPARRAEAQEAVQRNQGWGSWTWSKVTAPVRLLSRRNTVVPPEHVGEVIAHKVGGILRHRTKATVLFVSILFSAILSATMYQTLPKNKISCMTRMKDASKEDQRVACDPHDFLGFSLTQRGMVPRLVYYNNIINIILSIIVLFVYWREH
tara:strand:+ start:13959 stop:14732 length:774 start_codon:yes stop_codon:yes gene_type:complete